MHSDDILSDKKKKEEENFKVMIRNKIFEYNVMKQTL